MMPKTSSTLLLILSVLALSGHVNGQNRNRLSETFEQNVRAGRTSGYIPKELYQPLLAGKFRMVLERGMILSPYLLPPLFSH